MEGFSIGMAHCSWWEQEMGLESSRVVKQKYSEPHPSSCPTSPSFLGSDEAKSSAGPSPPFPHDPLQDQRHNHQR